MRSLKFEAKKLTNDYRFFVEIFEMKERTSRIYKRSSKTSLKVYEKKKRRYVRKS